MLQISEFVQGIKIASDHLHSLHVQVKGGFVFFIAHEKLAEWYEHMFNDYDNFVEWSKVFNIDIGLQVSAMTTDIDLTSALKDTKAIIDGVLVRAADVLECIKDDPDPYKVGIKSELESFCAYWSKIAGYMLRC